MEPNTESPTTFTARIAASLRLLPSSFNSSMARKEASSTTMELSTIIPTPSTSADKVSIFILYPWEYINTTAPSIAIGIEDPTIREAFQSPKKKKMMAMEITTAIIIVWKTLEREERMLSALSCTICTDRLGFFFSSSERTRFTSLLIPMSDPACVFFKPRLTVSSPLYRPILFFSSRAGRTVARSSRYRVFPVPVRMGSFRRACTVLYSSETERESFCSP